MGKRAREWEPGYLGSVSDSLRQDLSTCWISSFFIGTMGGQPAGLEKLEAQEKNWNHFTIDKLVQPHARCQLTATYWAETVMGPFYSTRN